MHHLSTIISNVLQLVTTSFVSPSNIADEMGLVKTLTYTRCCIFLTLVVITDTGMYTSCFSTLKLVQCLSDACDNQQSYVNALISNICSTYFRCCPLYICREVACGFTADFTAMCRPGFFKHDVICYDSPVLILS